MKQIILTLLFYFTLQIASFAQIQPVANRDSNNTIKMSPKDQLELKIFPNPVKSGKVTLEMTTDEMAEIRLVNIIGKEVLTKKFEFGEQKYQLQLREVPNGIYLLQVKTTDNKAVVKKLMISSD